MSLRAPPTSYYWQPYSGIEGYGLKERVTPKSAVAISYPLE